MPVYAYTCDGCKHSFDEYYRMDDRGIPLTQPCPKCGEMKVRQEFGTPPMLDSYRMGITKTPESWRDLLRNIKARNPGSTLNI